MGNYHIALYCKEVLDKDVLYLRCINWSKSTILPVTANSWSPSSQSLFSLTVRDHFKYLGVIISSNLSAIVQLNYSPVLTKISNDLKHWNTLPLSLIGRIATVKMKILPQINYLFSVIPFEPSFKWFQSLNSVISGFYWNNKTIRISLSTLQKNESQGGLDAPIFLMYYMANQLQFLKWIHINSDNEACVDLEQYDCKDIKLADLPFIGTSIKKHNCFKNKLISTLKIWWKIKNMTNSSMDPCIYSHIWYNPDFYFNKNPVVIVFSKWSQCGITHLHHLFCDNKFISFKDLTSNYAISI